MSSGSADRLSPVVTSLLQHARRARLTDDNVAIVLLLVAMAALAFITPFQNDTWWHLRSGLEMWQSKSLLLTERFSHTSFGADLQNHWWLTQLTFLAVYAAGGPALLTTFAGLCAFAAVYGSWRLTRGSMETRILLLLFLVLATAPEWSVRPHVISLGFLVVMVYLIRDGRFRWLPLVCVVWANAHAMVIFGVVMAGAVALEALIWSRERLKGDLAILALCAASPTISPLGLKYWPQILSTVGASKELGILEYRTPLDAVDLPFWLMLGALAVTTIVRRTALVDLTRADRVNLLASGVLAVAAVSAARNIAFFAVVAAPAFSRLLPAARSSRAREPRRAGWPAYALVGLAAGVASAVVASRWREGDVLLGWRPISDGALGALQACRGRVFNELEDGGFLMWALPERPVFVDSRMEAYPLELLRRARKAEFTGEYRDLFRDHDISCAMVRADSKLHHELGNDASMQLLYRDSRRAVFGRTDARSRAAAVPDPGRVPVATFESQPFLRGTP